MLERDSPMVLKKCLAAISIVALLGACTTIEEETGISKEAQKGAAVGAAAGGLLLGIASGKTGWVLAGTLIGGLLGGYIGDRLDESDKDEAGAAANEAITTKSEGEEAAWTNPETGNSGSTKIDDIYRKADGTLCKRFTETVEVDGETHKAEGAACEQPDGTWKIEEA